MTKASSAAIMAAANDNDLKARAIAIAAREGVKLPEAEISSKIYEFVTSPVDAEGNTVSSVYEYAMTVRNQALESIPPLPGANPAAITDDHLAYAIKSKFLPEATD